jgi:hypothetical protein
MFPPHLGLLSLLLDIYLIKDISTEGDSLADFYRWLRSYLNWVPKEDNEGRMIYNRICAYYFIMDQPTVLELQNKVIRGYLLSSISSCLMIRLNRGTNPTLSYQSGWYCLRMLKGSSWTQIIPPTLMLLSRSRNLPTTTLITTCLLPVAILPSINSLLAM